MPTYQYECKDCHRQFDLFQKFSDNPLTICPTCEGSVRRVIQNVGVVFKGSGWYINDSRPQSSEKKPPEKTDGDAVAVEKSAEPKTDSSETAVKPKKSTKAEPGTAPASAAAS